MDYLAQPGSLPEAAQLERELEAILSKANPREQRGVLDIVRGEAPGAKRWVLESFYTQCVEAIEF